MTSDFSDMASRVSDFRDDLEDEHEDATEESMGKLQNVIRENLISNDSIARSTLLRDIDEVLDTQQPQMVARAVTMPDWAKFLEHGTGPRAQRDTLPDHDQYKAPSPGPPIERILTWIVAKNITPTEYDTVYGLAEAIVEVIGEQGTFPSPFYRPAWHGTQGYQNVIQANKHAQKRALRRL